MQLPEQISLFVCAIAVIVLLLLLTLPLTQYTVLQ